MSPLSRTRAQLFAASALLIAASLPAASKATTPFPFGAQHHTLSCDRNPNIDPTLRICRTTQNGTTYYQLDSADGTRAEFAISSSGIDVQQSGPDPVRIMFTSVSSSSTQPLTPVSGITRRAYQDAVLAIDAVQDGSHPPMWAIYPLTSWVTPPLQGICTGALCSGGFQTP